MMLVSRVNTDINNSHHTTLHNTRQQTRLVVVLDGTTQAWNQTLPPSGLMLYYNLLRQVFNLLCE